MNKLRLNRTKTAWYSALALTFACCSGVAMAQEAADQPKSLDKLLLTPEQRTEIDAQRLQYLRSQEIKDIEGKEVKKEGEDKAAEKSEPAKKMVKRRAPMKPKVVLPKNISVSAVIERADGTRFIRINDQFNTSPSRHIKLDHDRANLRGADLEVGGKPVHVPVGTTYQPGKNRVIDSYKLKPKPAKGAKSDAEQKILKADEKAVKRTLKDVQTVNTPKENARTPDTQP